MHRAPNALTVWVRFTDDSTEAFSLTGVAGYTHTNLRLFITESTGRLVRTLLYSV